MSKRSWADLGIEVPLGANGEVRTLCPACSHLRKKKNERCLAVNLDTNVALCHHCGETFALKSDADGYGTPHREVPKIASAPKRPLYRPAPEADSATIKAHDWLEQKRGIPVAVSQAAKIEARRVWIPNGTTAGDEWAITFPYFRDGAVINVKWRTTDKRFRMEKGAELCLYGLDSLTTDTLVWVEGEIDQLSVTAAGIGSCVSVPNGAPPPDARSYERQFAYIDSAAARLETVQRHIIAVDNDPPGKRLRDELIRRLGPERCVTVEWPEGCKDANDVLRAHGAEALRSCLDAAKPVAIGDAVPVGDTPGDAAKGATLRADIACPGDRVRAEEEEAVRENATIAQLRSEIAALEAVIAHPNQTVSVGALDLIEEAERSYAKGDVLTQNGKDYARCVFKGDKGRRSPATRGRAFRALRDDGKLDAITRCERVETPGFKGESEIGYIHIPAEQRGRRGVAVLAILPAPVAKKHGGSRTIVVPPEVAAQQHPVRRQRENNTRWFDALSGDKITTERPVIGTDYWTARGEHLTRDEVEEQRVRAGYQPAPPPPWQPNALPARLRLAPQGEPLHLETVPTAILPLCLAGGCSHRVDRRGDRYCAVCAASGEGYENASPEPIHLDDIHDHSSSSHQDESPPPDVAEIPGRCLAAECRRAATLGGYCQEHAEAYLTRYTPSGWGYAADTAGG